FAAVVKEGIAIAPGLIEVVEKHVFVIAFQEDTAWSFGLQSNQTRHYAFGGGPSVDIVAEETHGVTAPRINRIEEALELVETPVDISDHISARHCRPAPSAPRVPRIETAAIWGLVIHAARHRRDPKSPPPLRS